MKIGIVGTGNMGRTLGIVWAELGHEVFFGSRDAQKGKQSAEFACHDFCQHNSSFPTTAAWWAAAV